MILDSVKLTALTATDMEQDWACISIVGPFPAMFSPNTTKAERGGDICATLECLGCLINKVSNTLEFSKQIKMSSYKLSGIYYTFSFILKREELINRSLDVLWLSPRGCHVSGILKQWKAACRSSLDCSAPMLDTYVFPVKERSLIPSQVSGNYPSLWNRNTAF